MTSSAQMRPRRRRLGSLRARITLAMLVLGFVGAAVFAFGIFIAAERLERSVLNRHIQAEFDQLAATAREQPGVDTIKSALLLGFVGRDNPDLPDTLAAMPPGGYHAVSIGDKQYQVHVGDADGRRVYVAYDITEWEALERPVIYVLVTGVVLSALLAVWFGMRVSAQVIAPVTNLARRLKSLEPKQRNVRLAPEFVGEEVSTIAEAFDRYMERLDGFVEREQMFTSAAAHELRTPLAVMQGAADVLLEEADLPPRARRAGERIRRATREMREFIEALLLLSRETRTDGLEHAACELRGILEQMTEDYRTLVDTECVELELTAADELVLDVPPALPTIVIGNLLRNAIENTESGHIRITLEGHRLSVSDTGRGIAEEAKTRLFERGYSTKPGGGGMGLELARRISERYGWRLELSSAPGVGTTASIEFPAARAGRPGEAM